MSNDPQHFDDPTAGGVRQRDHAGAKSAARGILLVVSAPSGAGKSTLVDRVIGRINGLKCSVSYTTRKARGAERDGIDYHFVSEQEFLEMRDRGEFLESATVHGQLYGTQRAATEALMASGYDVILDIDVQGAEQIRRQMPDAVTVFILPPSKQVLESRLRARNLNAPEDLRRRLLNAANEVKLYEQFKYVIVNDNLDHATAALEAIVIAERHRAERQRGAAREIIYTFGGELFYA
jgi:guanylate kinase